MRTVSRAITKRQLKRELGSPRWRRGSDHCFGARDQLGLQPGQRGGAVVVEENVPVVVSLGILAILCYVGVPITTVGYDYSIRDLLKNRRGAPGRSSAAVVAMRAAEAESASRARMRELKDECVSIVKSSNKIWVPVR